MELFAIGGPEDSRPAFFIDYLHYQPGNDNSKPGENRGRKANGSKTAQAVMIARPPKTMHNLIGHWRTWKNPVRISFIRTLQKLYR
jgi:hypothetical protein